MHFPRKRFGQHFLRDQSVISHILSVFAVQPGEHIVEIGPGDGALTIPLLNQIKQLEVIELDRDLLAELQRRCARVGELKIYSADILKFNLASLKTDDRLLKIIGNLPYNISTPLIFHLLNFTDAIETMLFMLQKEVAERLAAAVDTPHYGRLSVMVQYYYNVELLFDVSAHAFYPPPKVESSMVRLTPYRALPYVAKDYALFATLVKRAFGQRRKILRNSLKDLLTEDAWIRSGIVPDRRPETLSVSEFVELSNNGHLRDW